MKTNFRQRNRPNTTLRVLGIAILTLVISGGALFISKGVLIAALSPFWGVRDEGVRNIAGAFQSVRSKDSLIAENQELKELLNSKEIELLFYRNNRVEEGGATSSAVALKDVPDTSLKASVLLAPPLTPYDILLINMGESDGVVTGNRVTLPEGPELGRVMRTFVSSSEVELFSSNAKETAAVLERNMVPVVLIGRGGGNASFEVPREVEVIPGDRILSREDDGVMAIVGVVEAEPTDSFKHVLVRTVVNIQGLRSVRVLP